MIKLLELFGGIGACSKAFDKLKIEYEIADYVEIDKYAVASYNAIHNTNFEPQDITKWDKDIEVDLIMHGSPCQDFSSAGLQRGGDEGSGTRSSLMYETIRIVNKLKPKYIIWENVKNLLSKNHIHNFNRYLEIMGQLGYINYYKVLNAEDYGIPQHRERIFTISIRKDIKQSFYFPDIIPLKLELKNLLENEVEEKYFVSALSTNRILNSTFCQEKKRIQYNKVCDTLLARDFKDPKVIIIETTTLKSKCKRLKKLVENITFKKGQVLNLDIYNQKTNEKISQTLTDPQHNTQRIFDGQRLRKLTPKEYWRLMGFDDEDVEKASKVNSDTQLYKQAGNSIVVNVLEAILNNLLIEKKQNPQLTIFDLMGDE